MLCAALVRSNESLVVVRGSVREVETAGRRVREAVGRRVREAVGRRLCGMSPLHGDAAQASRVDVTLHADITLRYGRMGVDQGADQGSGFDTIRFDAVR